MRITSLAALLSISILSGCASAPKVLTPMEADTNALFLQLQGSIEADRLAHLHLTTPGSFQELQNRLDEAQALHVAGAEKQKVLNALSAGMAEQKIIDRNAETAKPILRDAWAARQAALESGASRFASAWKDADMDFTRAGQDLEAADLNGLRDRAPELVNAYRALELKALDDNQLGVARQTVRDARDNDAETRAPYVLRDAEEKIAAAAALIAEHRAHWQGYRESVQAAIFAAHRLQAIYEAATWIEHSTAEELALWIESRFDSFRKPLALPDLRDQPLHAQASRLEGSVAEAPKARDSLLAQLDALKPAPADDTVKTSSASARRAPASKRLKRAANRK